MKFVALSAFAVSTVAAQYAAPAPASYAAPPPPPAAFALAAASGNKVAMCPNALIGVYGMAPVPGCPLAKVLGLIQDSLVAADLAVTAAAKNVASAAAAVVAAGVPIQAYEDKAGVCTTYSADFLEFQACTAAPGICAPTASPTGCIGAQVCTPLTGGPAGAQGTPGYCLAPPTQCQTAGCTAAQVCIWQEATQGVITNTQCLASCATDGAACGAGDAGLCTAPQPPPQIGGGSFPITSNFCVMPSN